MPDHVRSIPVNNAQYRTSVSTKINFPIRSSCFSCVFVIEKEGVSLCSIEKAYLDGEIDFKKPISCHLFPIRVKEYRDFDAVNYEEIKICKPACECGSKLEVLVYAFSRKPLIRKYGEDWYQKLLEATKLLGK